MLLLLIAAGEHLLEELELRAAQRGEEGEEDEIGCGGEQHLLGRMWDFDSLGVLLPSQGLVWGDGEGQILRWDSRLMEKLRNVTRLFFLNAAKLVAYAYWASTREHHIRYESPYVRTINTLCLLATSNPSSPSSTFLLLFALFSPPFSSPAPPPISQKVGPTKPPKAPASALVRRNPLWSWSFQATSSFGSAARNGTLAKTAAWDAITPSSPRRRAM